MKELNQVDKIPQENQTDAVLNWKQSTVSEYYKIQNMFRLVRV